MTLDRQGILLCSRYAFAPNLYHYCGPERQNDLKSYIEENISDRGLVEILHKFETLYPYLTLIASANRIKDPFDRRVVDAYWLGNRLLGNVHSKDFADHLTDKLNIQKKVKRKDFLSLMDHTITGMPFHTYHVINIFVRTGHFCEPQTLSTMDNCRISWGKVVSTGKQYIIETQPLTVIAGKLQLGMPAKKVVTSLAVKPKVGDWVSVHWGYVCEILTLSQRSRLLRYTDFALRQTHI